MSRPPARYLQKQALFPSIHLGMTRELLWAELREPRTLGQGRYGWLRCPEPQLGLVVISQFHVSFVNVLARALKVNRP